jgi:predicted secreted protein
MTNVMRAMRATCGLLVGLGLALALALPAAAQESRELPTGAARVVEKIQLEVLTGTNQIKFHVAQILENNAGVIPGK